MTLLEACEPLLQYVCRLNRSARKGVRPEMAGVRSEILAQLALLRSKAASQPGLGPQVEKMELPLIYFVDFMIKESELPFAREWKELAHERGKLAGDEEFFDLMDADLGDASQEASERLSVYYACLGLGFTGFYTGQPEYLRNKMMEVSARIREYLDANPDSKICPDAYEHTDTSDLVETPGRSVVAITIVLIGLIIVLFVANAALYRTSSSELRSSLTTITDGPSPEGQP